MAFPIALVASLIGSIAPTIAKGLMLKGTIAQKAMGIFEGFVEKLGVPKDKDLEYALKEMNLEHILALKQLDAEFRMELERNKFEIDSLIIKGQVGLLRGDSKSLSNIRRWWRPFVAWSCGFGLSFYVFIFPLLQTVLAGLLAWDVINQGVFDKFIYNLPQIEMDLVISLIVPLLGLGVYRTFEKLKGTANDE